MEPVAAIAFTCNILDLIEKAIQCGKIVRKLHDIGTTDGHRELEEMTGMMETVVKDLEHAQSKVKQLKSATDSKVVDVIAKTNTLCTSLRDVLKKCKPVKEGSWRSAGLAALRTLQKSSDIRKFQKDLEGYREELSILIPITVQERVTDMVDRLKQLETQMSHDIYVVQRNLERLGESLKTAAGDLRQMLESLQDAFQEAQDAIKRKMILRVLWFPDIDTRFRAIHDAQRNTFKWIFRNPEMLREKEPKLKLTFTDWLELGSGIFHISGKAGSGKSTLMKFLCDGDEDHVVEGLLRTWAESNGKALIFSKFFFFRVTAVAEQRTLKGLIRSLLHSVLLQVPSLTQRLFPRRWDQRRGLVQDISSLELGDREISRAFEILVTDNKILQEYRICFFIDGLDEFDQSFKLQNKTHYGFANDLRTWTDRSNGNVKMCVSSRPLPEFMNVFPASQRIMLQNLTENDIETLVTSKLNNNEYFAKMMQGSKEMVDRCTRLRTRILTEAHGVFLWVGLILNQLEQALGEGDSLDVLERIVEDSSDKNLDDFFETIVQSIPEHHRPGSYFLLSAVMRMSGVLISAPKTEIELKVLEDILLPDVEEQYLTLAHSALVFHTADKDKQMNFDPSLAEISRKLGRPNVSRARDEEHLSIRCRGLVEVDGNGYIRFTHRAIPESLQHSFSKDNSDEKVTDARVAEMLTWLALADAKEYQAVRLGGQPRNGYRGISIPYLLRRLRECDLTGCERIFRLLHNIDVALDIAPSDGQWMTQVLDPFRSDFHPEGSTLDILRQCQILGISEYVGWALDNHLALPKDKDRILTILSDLLFAVGAKGAYVRSASADFLVTRLVETGFYFDTTVPSEDKRTSQWKHGYPTWIWHQFLAGELFFQATGHAWRRCHGYPDHEKQFNWKGIEIMLKLGADPEIWLAEAEEWEKGILTGPNREILYNISPADFLFYYEPEFKRLPPEVSRISLAGFIKLHRPLNCKELLELIKDNLKTKHD